MIQLAMPLEAPRPAAPAADTQCDVLLRALKRGEALTAMDSLAKYGCFRLAARVNELRCAGWPINSATRTLPNGKRIAVYSMERE